MTPESSGSPPPADGRGLSRAEERLVLLASHACAGRVEALEADLHSALADAELSIDELLEFVLHLAVYAGWPRAAQAEVSVRTTWIRHHKSRGAKPERWPLLGAAGLGPDSRAELVAKGEAKFEEINLFPSPPADSPFFQLGLVSFVFGQVWTRPQLTNRQRRLVTLPCVGESAVPGALQAHVGSAIGSADLEPTELERTAELVEQAGSVRAADLIRAAASGGRQPSST